MYMYIYMYMYMYMYTHVYIYIYTYIYTYIYVYIYIFVVHTIPHFDQVDGAQSTSIRSVHSEPRWGQTNLCTTCWWRCWARLISRRVLCPGEGLAINVGIHRVFMVFFIGFYGDFMVGILWWFNGHWMGISWVWWDSSRFSGISYQWWFNLELVGI